MAGIRMTKADLEAEIKELRKRLDSAGTRWAYAVEQLQAISSLLSALEASWPEVRPYWSTESGGPPAPTERVKALAKLWFVRHSVASSDHVTRGLRALLLAGGESEWLDSPSRQIKPK